MYSTFCAIILLADYKLQCSIFSLFQNSSPVFPTKLPILMFHYIIHIKQHIFKSRYIRCHTVPLLEQPNYPSVAHDRYQTHFTIPLFYIHLQIDLESILRGSSQGVQLLAFLLLKNVHLLCEVILSVNVQMITCKTRLCEARFLLHQYLIKS